MSARVQNKVAIVTGAGRGIGAATARLLAAEGATVVLADRKGDNAAAVAAEITAGGGRADARTTDMGVPEEVRSLIEDVVASYGRIDILVNNAAATYLDRKDLNIVEADLEVWNKVIQINLNGPMLASRHAIPHMIAQGGGAIVMVSSMAHRLASGDRPAYDVSKAGLNALVRSIAVAFGKKGVRCNAVAPGFTLAPGVQNLPEPIHKAFAENTMTPSLGRPFDQAAAILFLASEEAAFVNGAVLEVDGALGVHLPVVPTTG